MGQVRKVGDVYFIEFHARGLLYSQIAGPNEVEALRMLEAVEAKLAAGETLTVVRETQLDFFFQEFLQFAQQEHSASSYKRFDNLIKHFTAFLKNNYPSVIYLSHVTPVVVESYKQAWVKKSRPHKINLSILLLREIMEYGIKLGFINDNPTLHVTLLPGQQRNYIQSPRFKLAKDLLGKSVPLGKVVKLLKLSDVGRIMYFSNLMPRQREEVR